MAISISPAIMVDTISPSIPFWAAIVATIVAKAAVGPAICTRLPPRKDITKPAAIAVYIPLSGVTPEARARAIERGRAIIATIMPDTTSLANCAVV